MPNKRGIGCGCCWENCTANKCCRDDDIPNEVEVTLPDFLTGTLTPDPFAGKPDIYPCDNCGSVAGTYVLARTDSGDSDNSYAWAYEDTSFCSAYLQQGSGGCVGPHSVKFRIAADLYCDNPLFGNLRGCRMVVTVQFDSTAYSVFCGIQTNQYFSDYRATTSNCRSATWTCHSPTGPSTSINWCYYADADDVVTVVGT